jgi:uncharacterized protein YunC (DUF1805 family)
LRGYTKAQRPCPVSAAPSAPTCIHDNLDHGYIDHDNLDHDNLDHGYIMTGYLDIDIKNSVYNNSKTSVNSVHVITCVHDNRVVIVEVKRREMGKALTHHRCSGCS